MKTDITRLGQAGEGQQQKRQQYENSEQKLDHISQKS